MHVPRIRRVQTAQPDCMWVQGECWFPQPWSSHGSLLQWGCDVPSFNIPWLYNRRWVMSWGSPCSSSPSVCISVSLPPLILGFLKNVSSASASHISAVPIAAVRAPNDTPFGGERQRIWEFGKPLAFVCGTGRAKRIWSVNINYFAWHWVNRSCIAAIKCNGCNAKWRSTRCCSPSL